ncbi:Membrane-associated lipoprotein precursor [Mycoplasmopsis maculosa]|uniref:Membrane-associated lipoprotein n=1 Tax=Mycoplasmopsis maculosa TaxID=114885 RepID=A0A449B3U0_9BACT|nr:DUF31 family protein [Mycoplasmopsis maculosa]VEU75235.1 Membrane-associated lipoprotein precursor [Mycoplasmopsis maculosa]
MKKKILLNLSLISNSFAIPFIASSCQTEKVEKPEIPNNPDKQNEPSNPEEPKNPDTTLKPNEKYYSTSEAKEFIKDKKWNEIFEITNNFGASYETKTAEDFVNNYLDYGIKPKDEKLSISYINVKKSGDTEVTITLNINDNTVDYVLTNFKEKENNPFDNSNEEPTDLEQYLEKSNAEKWDEDFAKYSSRLNSFRSQNPYNPTYSNKEEYNRKAEALGLPNYDQASLLGQILPIDNNKLSIPKTQNPQFENWYDNFGVTDKYKNHGLARTITNDTYAKAAMHSYSLTITNSLIPGDDDSIKSKLRHILRYREDFTDMVNAITNIEKRNEWKKKWDAINPNGFVLTDVGSIKLFRHNLVNELIKQEYVALGGSLDDLDVNNHPEGGKLYVKDHSNKEKVEKFIMADEKNVWEKIWKPHILKFHEIIYSDLDKSGLDAKLINKIKNIVKKETDFWNLVGLVDKTNGGAGTAFIIDYETPTNGNQPTKFYFATNLHVLDSIIEDSFISFGLTRLKYKSIGNKLKTTAIDTDNFIHFGFNSKVFDIIWTGRDYLNQDPSNWFNDSSISEKEFIDIAIFEIDFSKLTPEEYGNQNNLTLNQFIELVTNNYANSQEKASFINYDYLNNYDKIKFSKIESSLDNYDTLYALGYPGTSTLKTHGFEDYFLDQYENKRDLDSKNYTFSLWTNAKYDLYGKDFSSLEPEDKVRIDRGSGLGYNLNYRTFKDKHGIIDSFLTAPRLGKELYLSNDGNRYYNVSLAYNIDRYTPGGGASGSSVRNQDNKIVGLFHVSNYNAYAGLTESIRSNGFNYNGLFGNYNLPQYDVIYGGGKDQKTSYRQALLNKKGASFKTYLFDNLNTIPEEFRFSN